ncbi:hypothetical protein [Nonomuraea terrae]|uniref:hypothetical protein n=1 Tax=Nonomuraea terrae TaxID=2530383 RepID=UPI001404B914|nr:hypothetical protein [Nonomuraea terrae]
MDFRQVVAALPEVLAVAGTDPVRSAPAAIAADPADIDAEPAANGTAAFLRGRGR